MLGYTNIYLAPLFIYQLFLLVDIPTIKLKSEIAYMFLQLHQGWGLRGELENFRSEWGFPGQGSDFRFSFLCGQELPDLENDKRKVARIESTVASYHHFYSFLLTGR